jgi:ADA HAT complex component 1
MLSPVDLSPHAVESNPGLVSDHDDDDDEDADDAHSQPDFILNDDVVVEDASDVEGVRERTGSRQGLDSCCFAKGEGSRKH